MEPRLLRAGISLLTIAAAVAACQVRNPGSATGSASVGGRGPVEPLPAEQVKSQSGDAASATSPGGPTNSIAKGSEVLTPIQSAPGFAEISGIVKDLAGKAVPGAVVRVGNQTAVTSNDGRYKLTVGSASLVNVKVSKTGYILRDSSIPVSKDQKLVLDVALVKADQNITRISSAIGGTARSADGSAELILPPGALKGDADVRVTWLKPIADPKTPAAFRLQQTDANGDLSVTELNDTELPGPLETMEYQNRRYFSPVSFADVAMSNGLQAGASAQLRMAVDPQVAQAMLSAGDLTESNMGQEIFPCFSWNADTSVWDKPALSKVERDADGKYWFVYTVRANNMTAAPAAYRQLFQLGDDQGSATVTLIVGGGRRVVDGTYIYSALIERSSDSAYDWKGASFVNGETQSVTIEGGSNKTPASGNYRSPTRKNLVRPNVQTQNYTGTLYGSILNEAYGTGTFDTWDRNGMFQLSFPPGEGFDVNPPSILGVSPSPARQTGTTSTAAEPYLPLELSFQIRENIVQQQAIPATYLKPFFYRTDCKVNLTFTGETPREGQAKMTYTLDGQEREWSGELSPGAESLTFDLPRNAAGTPRAFALQNLTVGEFINDPGESVRASLPPGGDVTATVKMMFTGVK
ncbi:MAG: carboxypeptidase-like regulatory domain-containing protein [Candidatus Sericytochromatia bacterium]|nr:carboxypeptidase-like regulatory domain-containing protein [Candidatus Sericytochromatia bacterium]